MKYYLLNLAAFSVVLILLFLGTVFILSEIHEFKPSTYFHYKEFNSAFIERDYELIAIGNSKLLQSLDKDILQKKINLKTVILGFTAANISVSRLTLEAYLNRCVKKPKVVLFEVSWFSFNPNRTHLYDITGDLQLTDPSLFKYIFRYGKKYRNNYFKAIKRQILYSKLNINNNSVKPNNENNFNKKNYNFDLVSFEKVFPTHFAGFDKILLEDFNKIVSICKKNDIELILYTSPEDSEYSLNQIDRKEVKQVFYNLSSTNEKIIYLDYTLGGALYNEKFEFWLEDSHHIYENELFTEKLVKDIKESQKHKVFK